MLHHRFHHALLATLERKVHFHAPIQEYNETHPCSLSYIICLVLQKNMASLRSSKIKEAASKGGADVVLVEYQPAKASAAKKQVERAGGQFTHLITELADPSAVLTDLGLKPPSEGGPQPIRPLWVSKCTTAKSRVPEEEFTDFTKVEALPAPKGVPAKDDSGRPAKKARGDDGA